MKTFEVKNREFNMNKSVKNNLDYIFIEGDGCFFFTKEDADKAHYKTGNEVGLYYVEKEINGKIMFQQCESNVWN
jgi:hypothetical protein